MRKGANYIDMMGKRDEVMQMVLQTVPYTQIGRRIGCDDETVRTYVRRNLMKEVALGSSRSRRKLSEDFMESLKYQQDRCERLIEACHEWLRKPGRSGKYTLDPRADEITVVYRTTEVDMATGKEREVKKEATLQELIDGREDIVSLKWKYSDPRALIVSALEEARKESEIIAKVTGDLKEISETVDVHKVVSMVISILTDDELLPADARRRLIDRMEEGMALIEQEIIAG